MEIIIGDGNVAYSLSHIFSVYPIPQTPSAAEAPRILETGYPMEISEIYLISLKKIICAI